MIEGNLCDITKLSSPYSRNWDLLGIFVSACLLKHTYALYRKEGIFPDLNSQLVCGKFYSCDQKLDDLVSRTATK